MRNGIPLVSISRQYISIVHPGFVPFPCFPLSSSVLDQVYHRGPASLIFFLELLEWHMFLNNPIPTVSLIPDPLNGFSWGIYPLRRDIDATTQH